MYIVLSAQPPYSNGNMIIVELQQKFMKKISFMVELRCDLCYTCTTFMKIKIGRLRTDESRRVASAREREA